MTVIRNYTVPGPGLRFAVVSDLQDRNYRDLINLVIAQHPDAILLPGNILERINYDDMEDMHHWCTKIYGETHLQHLVDVIGCRIHGKYSNKNEESRNKTYGVDFLKEVSRIAPTFYSLGNLEWSLSASDKKLLDECGITLLDNSDVETEINGKRVLLGGLSTRYDLQWLVSFCQKQGFKVLLSHHPDLYRHLIQDTIMDSVDLVVGGHYHGGQWRIGNRGVYIPRVGVLRKNIVGQFDRLIISAGAVNTSRLPRFGNPCELVIVDAK